MTNHRTTGDEAIQSGLHGHLVTAHPAGCNAPHRVHRAFILNQKPNDLSAEGMFPKGGRITLICGSLIRGSMAGWKSKKTHIRHYAVTKADCEIRICRVPISHGRTDG